MWLWTLKISILSFLFIWIVHHLFIFFRDNLTTPKIKDMVNIPQQKYEDIFKHIQYTTTSSSSHSLPPSINTPSTEVTPISSLPVISEDSMKDELASFLHQFSEQQK